MHGHTFRPGGMLTTTTDETRPDEARCFADEVIVDFPSVAPALNRMRQAFLADERSRPTQAVIQLSSRDALEGVNVPLCVSVRYTCLVCGGRGESWTESCLRCKGAGHELVAHQLQVTVPAGVVDGTRLRFTVMTPHNQPTRVELRITVA